MFDLGRLVAGLVDAREKPQVPTEAVWWSVFGLFATRRESLNALEVECKNSTRFENLVGERLPSADTLGRVYGLLEAEGQREMLSQINHRMKRNKGLGVPWKLGILAFDGHEFFASLSRCCPRCCQRRETIHGQELTVYYHRGVVCHLIGAQVAVPLDVEMIQPGEGEAKAARRLLDRVMKRYARFFVGVIGDALYAEAGFFNACLDHGKHIVAVLKDDRRALMKDLQGLLPLEPPQEWMEKSGKAVRLWDFEGFKTFEGVRVPVRAVYCQETQTRRERVAGSWIEKTETNTWCWVTTFSKLLLPSRPLWQVGHGRWDIENDAFNTLASHWGLDHCFRHDPVAIVNFILTLFITYILLQCFYYRNLKSPRRQHLTLIGLANELHISLETATEPAPWLQTTSDPAP
jgi:hypothetical protein